MSVIVPSPLALGMLTNQIRNAGRPADIRTAEALDQIGATVNSINQALTGIVNTPVVPPPPPSVVPVILLQETAVPTATTTNITPIAPVTLPLGAAPPILIIVLTCDATGGGLITWDNVNLTLKNTSANDIINGANQLDFYVFVGRSDGNWWRILSMLGVNP